MVMALAEEMHVTRCAIASALCLAFLASFAACGEAVNDEIFRSSMHATTAGSSDRGGAGTPNGSSGSTGESGVGGTAGTSRGGGSGGSIGAAGTAGIAGAGGSAGSDGATQEGGLDDGAPRGD